jgi:hypothetical protein
MISLLIKITTLIYARLYIKADLVKETVEEMVE